MAETKMSDPKISDLTVTELQTMIRQTVQEAMAEVIMEFTFAAEADAKLQAEAELNEYFRSSVHSALESEIFAAYTDD